MEAMNDFCIDRISVPAQLRLQHGILRQEVLGITFDAHAAADAIRQNARADAAALLDEAHAEAARLAQRAEQQVFERAEALLQALNRANQTFLDRATDSVVDLAQALFDRLVLRVKPREQIEATLRRILREAPPKLVDAMLRVHPDDLELVPEVEWEVKADPSLPRGTCRLEASAGEWRADFAAAVEALKASLNRSARL